MVPFPLIMFCKYSLMNMSVQNQSSLLCHHFNSLFHIANTLFWTQLGGPGPDQNTQGNLSFAVERYSGLERSQQVVIMSSDSGVPYWSGVQEILLGSYQSATASLDRHDLTKVEITRMPILQL